MLNILWLFVNKKMPVSCPAWNFLTGIGISIMFIQTKTAGINNIQGGDHRCKRVFL